MTMFQHFLWSNVLMCDFTEAWISDFPNMWKLQIHEENKTAHSVSSSFSQPINVALIAELLCG